MLNIECCWIQTIRNRKLLSLAADRGFNDRMRAEIASMDLTHSFCGQIIGMGKKIIIPDLSNDGAYGLASFRTTGYRWLVAVPLMTYRPYGLLGTASKNRKILEKDTADLIMVIGGLIANALSKAHLTGIATHRSKSPEVSVLDINKTPSPDTKTEIAPVTPAVNVPLTEASNIPVPEKSAATAPEKGPPKKIDPFFHSHKRKMESFRRAHG